MKRQDEGSGNLPKVLEAKHSIGSELASYPCSRTLSMVPISGRTRTENRMIVKALMATALVALAGSAFAQDAAHHAQELTPADVKFQDDPAFPKGVQTAVVYGDPSKPGMFLIRVKMPPNSVIAPHTHPVFESVSILSGAMGSGMGEKFDKSKGKVLEAGSLLLLPANHSHFVWAEDQETILQVAAIGPFDLTYINPEDDPRKK